jgi:hypothetical protein
MIASRLTRLIETHSDDLASTLMQKWLGSEALADLARVPPAELRQRVYEVYHNLSDWLLYRTELDIEKRYTEIGARRATQNVPLSVVLGALAAVKLHLWEFVRREGLMGGHVELHQALELLQLVDHFFDRAVFYTARGYERESKRAAVVREAVLARAG